jgi:hypothetical protein
LPLLTEETRRERDQSVGFIIEINGEICIDRTTGESAVHAKEKKKRNNEDN